MLPVRSGAVRSGAPPGHHDDRPDRGSARSPMKRPVVPMTLSVSPTPTTVDCCRGPARAGPSPDYLELTIGDGVLGHPTIRRNPAPTTHDTRASAGQPWDTASAQPLVRRRTEVKPCSRSGDPCLHRDRRSRDRIHRDTDDEDGRRLIRGGRCLPRGLPDAALTEAHLPADCASAQPMSAHRLACRDRAGAASRPRGRGRDPSSSAVVQRRDLVFPGGHLQRCRPRTP